MDVECIILKEVIQSQKEKKSYTLSHMQNLFNHICVYMDICAYICVYTYKQIFMWVQITCRKENEKG